MIRCLVFSRDRALQLDAVLRSLFLHCLDIDDADIFILYKTTSGQHEKQYQELIEEFSGRVFFKRQKNFRHDVLLYLQSFEKNKFIVFVYQALFYLGQISPPLGSLLDRFWRRTVSRILIFLSTFFLGGIQREDLALFLVDDNIFIQDFYLESIVNVLKQENELLGFSLRLGKNTTYRYSRGQEQALPIFNTISDNIIRFDWTQSKGDFGYPLEVSSSVYRVGDILPLLMGFSFNNPNVLEERLAYHAKFLRKEHPQLACYQRSVTFCNPINLVQSVMPNRAGENIKYDIDILSSLFEQGERIKVDTYSGFIPRSCHQEVELVFEKLGDKV